MNGTGQKSKGTLPIQSQRGRSPLTYVTYVINGERPL